MLNKVPIIWVHYDNETFPPPIILFMWFYILTTFGVVSVNWQKIKASEKHEKSTKETNQRLPSCLFSLKSRLNITLRRTPFSTFYKANGSFKHIEKDKQVRAVLGGVTKEEKGDLGFIVI